MADLGTEPNAFGKALLDFLEDMRNKADKDNPFYQQVLLSASQLLISEQHGAQADYLATDFQRFIGRLEQDHSDDSKTRWLFRKLRPAVECLSQYTRIADVMIQAAPDCAMVLYGGAKLLLQLAQGIGDCFERVVDVLLEVGHLLQVYAAFGEAYQRSADMQSLLCESYKNILRFWQEACAIFRGKAYKFFIKGIIESFTKKWDDFYKILLKDSRQLQSLGIATEARMRHRKETTELQAAKEAERNAIISWIAGKDNLSEFDVRPQLEKPLSKRVQGTCDWLLNSDLVKDWETCRSSRIAWLSGSPGAGKTVATAALTREISQRQQCVLYFFASFREPATSSIDRLVRSLVLQLLRYAANVPGDLLHYYKQEKSHYADQRMTLVQAVKAFQTLVKTMERVYVFLDGLDELKNQGAMLVTIATLLGTKTPGILKWFCASRGDVQLEHVFREFSSAVEICANRSATEQDIRTFLADHPIMSRHSEKCREKWIEESAGNFLWIELISQIMAGEGSTCDDDIVKELRRFPKGLTGCYVRTLERLQEYSEPEQELARRLFVLIVYSYQPLTASEIKNALAVRSGATDHSDDRAPSLDLIEKLARPLFELDRSRGHQSDPVMRPIHKTVREFFWEDPDHLQIDSQLRGYFKSVQSGSLEIGLTCLTYLGYERFQSLKQAKNNNYAELKDDKTSFLKYASVHWHRHLSEDFSPPKDVYEKAVSFIRGPSFITCLSIQCGIAPHLFMALERHHEADNDVYRPNTEVRDISRQHYGVPLPLWLDDFDEDGRQIVSCYMSWMLQWQKVLHDMPDAFEQCSFDILGAGNPFSRHCADMCHVNYSSVRNDTSSIVVGLGHGSGLKKSIKWAKLTGKSTKYNSDQHNLRYFALDGIACKLNALLTTETNSSLISSLTISNAEHLHYPMMIRPCFKPASSKDSRAHSLAEAAQEAATELCETLLGKGKSTCHAILSLPAADHPPPDTEDSASDTESDCSTDSDCTTDSEESLPAPQTTRKATSILVARFTQHSGSVCRRWERSQGNPHLTTAATNPDQTMLVWSESFACVEMYDALTNRVIKKQILPAPETSKKREIVATKHDFQFSTCGNAIYTLTIKRVIQGDDITHDMMLSSMRTEDVRCAADTVELHQHSSLQCHTPAPEDTSCTCEADTSRILTSWTATHVYVLLPPSNDALRFVRMSVPSSGLEASIEIMSQPIYLPCSVYSSTATLFVQDLVNAEKEDVEITQKTVCHLIMPSLTTMPIVEGDSSQTPNTIVATWSCAAPNGWRKWDQTKDGNDHAGNAISKEAMLGRLKGSFVDPEQRFSVPIRSGMNWRKKAFVSCW